MPTDEPYARGRWAYWLFALVLGPLAADGVFLVVRAGTLDTDRGPTFALLPMIGAAVGALLTLPWTLWEPPARRALRTLVAAVLGAALSVAWGVALFIVVLAIACHGKDQCLG